MNPLRNISRKIVSMFTIKHATEEVLPSKVISYETFFRTVLDTMLEGCQILDHDLTYLYLNKTAEIHNRRPNKELIGNSYTEMWPGIESTRVISEIRRCLADRVNIHLENRFVYPDGKEGWFDLVIQPVPEGIMIMSYDISGRKFVEDGLKEREAVFSISFNASPIPVSFSDLATEKWAEVNQAFLDVTGYSRDEVIGHTFRDLNLWKYPEDRVRMRELLKTQGHVHGFEVDINKKDGTTGTMNISVEVVDLSGKPYLLVMGIDLTKRKKAEAELQFRNTMLTTQQETSLDAILVVDAMDNILTYNQRFIELWDVPEQIIRNKIDEPVLAYVSSLIANPDVFLERVHHLFEHKQETSTDELLLKNGRVINRYSAPMFGPDNRYLGRVWYFRDITTSRRAEEKILQLNTDLERRVAERTAQLVEANQELEAFSYSISHDLHAPLRGINGFTNILMEDYGPCLDDEGKRICAIIQENTLKMGRLIDDLLAFSRFSRNEMELKPIDMKSLVTSVFGELADDQFRKRAEITIGEICNAQGDPNMLRQVLVNLISNAIKYSSKREKPVITVTCKRDGENCIYCIRDNGVGFDMKYRDKIFGVFQRLQSEKEYQGTGVGLAIVRRIITRHHGEVWAESEPDKGATFYFTVPFIGPAPDPSG